MIWLVSPGAATGQAAGAKDYQVVHSATLAAGSLALLDVNVPVGSLAAPLSCLVVLERSRLA